MNRKEQISEEAKLFIAKNPKAWSLFILFTYQAMNSGQRNYSAKGVFERIRWETMIDSSFPDDFKINNNYTAFFARKFMDERPQHEGFFRTRKRISAEKPACTLPPLTPRDFESAGEP